ncbi:MAG: FAD-binding protein [Caldilineaceae bacterium]
MRDLLVIGAGWSGLSAALTAANHGLTVRVIAKGLGSMHWTAGSFDLLGYPFGHGTDAADTPVTDPLAAIADLPAAHPLARVGQDDVHIDAMRTALAAAGIRYAGREDGRNLLLPSPVGAARPAFLATEAQRAGALDRPEPMLVVGFQGMAISTRTCWSRTCVARASAPAEHLPLDLITPRRDINTVQMAQALDAPDVQKRLGAALNRLVRPGERIGLPASWACTTMPRPLPQWKRRGRAPLRDSHLAAQRTGRASAPGAARAAGDRGRARRGGHGGRGLPG